VSAECPRNTFDARSYTEPPPESRSPAVWEDNGAPEADRLGGTIERGNKQSADQKQLSSTLPEETEKFLRLLDPAATRFTFQTFHDVPRGAKADPRLARVTDSLQVVESLYRFGAGAWVAVNETDLRGRKRENTIRVRAVFQEADGGYGGPFPRPPSIVIETSLGRFHRYWLVQGHWPADGQGVADFRAVMERMVADYGSDPGAKDVTRVLRVPGFLHRKGHPFMVRMVSAPGHRYSRGEILAAFPPLPSHQCKPTAVAVIGWQPDGQDDKRIADALSAIPSDGRATWIEIGFALRAHYGERGKAIWDQWSQTSAKFDPADQERVWASFKEPLCTIATVFRHAKALGWKPSIGQEESAAWRAAGTCVARFPPENARVAFFAWHKRQSKTVSQPRAERIFQIILDKENARGSHRQSGGVR
jgi:Primase C terminal 2 (PriCT-2)/RepB DNA-primase from phage plasmid